MGRLSGRLLLCLALVASSQQETLSGAAPRTAGAGDGKLDVAVWEGWALHLCGTALKRPPVSHEHTITREQARVILEDRATAPASPPAEQCTCRSAPCGGQLALQHSDYSCSAGGVVMGSNPSGDAHAADSALPCSRGGEAGDYDVRLHVAAVGIMLAVSLAGALAPVGLRLSSNGAGVSAATRLGTYFGFGTILATALIHMLPPAAESLSSPCLPRFFSASGFGAWAYLFVLLAMCGMHLVDFLLKGHYQRKQLLQELEGEAEEEEGQGWQSSPLAHQHEGCHAHHAAVRIGALVAGSKRQQQQLQQQPDGPHGLACVVEVAAEEGRSGCSGAEEDDDDSAHCCEGEDDLGRSLLRPQRHKQHQRQGQQQQQRDATQIIGLMLTEAGIIFHSVMIGMTLGVTSGPAFKGLLAALCLHQLFEGFAIGSAAVDSGLSAAQSAVMGLAYSVTTPAGIVVGILVRESFDENAAGALLASGICDAVSAGVLLYVVLVGLITPMMTDSSWLRSQRWPMQVASFGAFYLGAGVMVVLGWWA